MNEDERQAHEIKEGLIRVLKGKYGYCGSAEGENVIRLNSGKENIVIKITWE